ncbi:MAG TPA: MFS transporter, partial [Candidatus Binatus sp.]|nr:MFS transporter [Candidatus Binatus sp.]
HVLGAFALALLGLAGFVWIELHTTVPLINVAMFKQRMLAVALATAVFSALLAHPIALAAPLYLQNVIGANALTAGFVLATLPLSTALASPISGRLADRFDAGTMTAIGMALILAGIVAYSRLGTRSDFSTVVAVLALLGAGIGVFTPANQKIAFASVAQEDYGVLAAMLSSFGTAAGTIGTTLTVALMELRGGGALWQDPKALAGAQQFAFAWLAPFGLLAVGIAIKSRPENKIETIAKS